MNLGAAQIQEGAPSWRVRVIDEVTSTNDVVRDLGLGGEAHGAVVFAEHQTSGRGRRQNRWLAPKGRDLMFSVLLRPEAPAHFWPRITTLAALAICKGIEQELPLTPAIKWPNDVYVADRKIAGLLAESLVGPSGMFIILGIGINVNTTEFPEAIRGSATSLSLELESEMFAMIDRNLLAKSILTSLDHELRRIDAGFVAAMEEVRPRSWLLGKTIRATADGMEVYGRATDLNHEGHLVIAFPDGSSRALSSADDVRCVV
jgi:BirA family transcriptional regulator, biotin operon repressor / biotin---[acetyl-CoA-carboxylase] ligase